MKIDNSIKFPAILLGNGLNNYSRMPFSWIDLLIGISSNALSKDSLNKKEITYPEYYDACCFRDGKGGTNYKTLKSIICEKVKTWDGTDVHKRLLSFVRYNKIPILTTNYDTTLNDELITKYCQNIKGTKNNTTFPLSFHNKKFTDFYPWFSYYSDHTITDAKNDFGIWHIHGFNCYKRSLVIGHIDYINSIHRLKEYIISRPDSLLKSREKNWIGTNSWIDIFFNCSLLIIGLALDSQEISLRWLLMEREKYYKKNEEKRRRTIFVTNSQFDKYGEGKKYLFDSLGIEHIECISGEEIYNNWLFLPENDQFAYNFNSASKYITD